MTFIVRLLYKRSFLLCKTNNYTTDSIHLLAGLHAV